MSAGATRSYDNGPKNHWRRTIWNEVLRRTKGRHRTDPVLYLAGPENIDLDVAVKKGVPASNMIAIDRCQANVDAIRAAGGSAICGDALDILLNWPMGRPVSAVLLDFCSGIENSNGEVFDTFQRRPLRGAAVAINFMRGRDPWSNPWRHNLKDAGLYEPLVEGVEPQNRAYQYLVMHAWDTVSTMVAGESTRPGYGARRLFSPDSNDSARMKLFRLGLSRLLAEMRPAFFSYRSGGSLVFDSVVFNHYCAKVDEGPSDLVRMVDADVEKCMTKDVDVARKIAATLAVRTMRQKAMHA